MTTMRNAQLDWVENNTPFSTQFGDIYFSRQQGLQESEYTYLAANQLPQRWGSFFQHNSTFVLAETGFGTGLNFLITWRAWHKYHQTSQRSQLHYVAVEKYPLNRQDLAKASSLWPELAPYSQQLLQNYPTTSPGFHRLNFPEQQLSLTLIFADATEGLQQLHNAQNDLVHAWYLDGFAPAKNPDMWTDDLFKQIGKLSASNCTLSSFTAAGFVRRGLVQQGFSMGKQAGWGTKREMLLGQYTQPEASTSEQSNQAPWFHSGAHEKTVRKVAIIGGGLAGCSTAYALAKQGIHVALFEQKPQLAAGASGNPIGVYYPAFNANHDAISQFYLNSILLLQQWLRTLNFSVQSQGCLNIAYEKRLSQRYQKLANTETLSPYLHWLSPDNATQHSGLNCVHPALLIKTAGQLSPEALCHAMWEHASKFSHHNQLHLNQDIQSITQQTQYWHLFSHNSQYGPFDAVVICNSYACHTFQQTQHYPLRIARGQLHWTSTPIDCALPICGNSYITAPDTGIQVLGSSFIIDDSSAELRTNETEIILQQLQYSHPNLMEKLHSASLHGRVSHRSVTQDHLPLVGPVVDHEAFLKQYQDLHKGRPAQQYASAPIYPGLYLNVAHGTRGISSCALAAETICNLIQHNVLPIPNSAYQLLHPARYFLRQLKRQQP